MLADIVLSVLIVLSVWGVLFLAGIADRNQH